MPDGRHKRKRHPLAKMRGKWTTEEDQLLCSLVQKLGEGNWAQIARALNTAQGRDAEAGRIGKQCRERWHHQLCPNNRKDAWTVEEEELLVKAHQELGNRWADIAKTIPGRSENAVKNHWNTSLRRRDLPDPEPRPLKIYMKEHNMTRPPPFSARKHDTGDSDQGGSGPKPRRPAPKRRRARCVSDCDDDTEDDVMFASSSDEATSDLESLSESGSDGGGRGAEAGQRRSAPCDALLRTREPRARRAASQKLRELVDLERAAGSEEDDGDTSARGSDGTASDNDLCPCPGASGARGDHNSSKTCSTDGAVGLKGVSGPHEGQLVGGGGNMAHSVRSERDSHGTEHRSGLLTHRPSADTRADARTDAHGCVLSLPFKMEPGLGRREVATGLRLPEEGGQLEEVLLARSGRLRSVGSSNRLAPPPSTPHNHPCRPGITSVTAAAASGACTAGRDLLPGGCCGGGGALLLPSPAGAVQPAGARGVSAGLMGAALPGEGRDGPHTWTAGIVPSVFDPDELILDQLLPRVPTPAGVLQAGGLTPPPTACLAPLVPSGPGLMDSGRGVLPQLDMDLDLWGADPYRLHDGDADTAGMCDGAATELNTPRGAAAGAAPLGAPAREPLAAQGGTGRGDGRLAPVPVSSTPPAAVVLLPASAEECVEDQGPREWGVRGPCESARQASDAAWMPHSYPHGVGGASGPGAAALSSVHRSGSHNSLISSYGGAPVGLASAALSQALCAPQLPHTPAGAGGARRVSQAAGLSRDSSAAWDPALNHTTADTSWPGTPRASGVAAPPHAHSSSTWAEPDRQRGMHAPCGTQHATPVYGRTSCVDESSCGGGQVWIPTSPGYPHAAPAHPSPSRSPGKTAHTSAGASGPCCALPHPTGCAHSAAAAGMRLTHVSASVSPNRRPIDVYTTAPGRVVVLTDGLLPTMDQLIAEHLPPLHTPEGSGIACESQPVLQLGSQGPVRVSFSGLSAYLSRAQLPSSAVVAMAARKDGSVDSAVVRALAWDLALAVHHACEGACAGRGMRGDGGGGGRPGYVVALRLGTETPPHHFSVLLALRGGNETAAGLAVGDIGHALQCLLC